MSEPSRYECCPKCLHAPLPDDQRLPAECPACGLVLAKFAVTARASGAEVEEGDSTPVHLLIDRIREAALYVPERVAPATFWGRAVLLGLFAVWGVQLIAMDYRTGGMTSSFLHGPLLIFHEAGHVVFMFFGEFMTILGGTLGQLLMPAVLVWALLFRHRDPFGAAIAVWFFGVSVLDVAPYVYDALDPQLILLGGHTGKEGGHDWIYLLDKTGLSSSAQTLGWMTHKMGALLVLASVGWAGWILARQKTRLG